MTINQLSIFLENKTGRINELTKILGKYGINMQAFSMAETSDFGILRLIVDDVERAVEVLSNENFAVKVTEVVHICCSNEAGALSKVLEHLTNSDISIEYMYAFAQGDKANAIIMPNDIEKCMTELKKCSCDINTL